MKKTFWNVSVVQTPDDNGYCVTFDNATDAHNLAAFLKAEGVWFVKVWK